MTIELTGGWSQIRVPLVQSSGNFTAALNRDYTITATATVTDPTPAEGRLFTSFVVNGTATIGGTAYSTAGAMVRRRYHSGAWLNYVYPHLSAAWTWTAQQSFSGGSSTVPAAITDATIADGRVRAGRLLSVGILTAPALGSITSRFTMTMTDAAIAGSTFAHLAGTGVNNCPVIGFGRSRGTSAVGTAVVSGDRLGAYRWYGDDGTDLGTTASMISSEVDGTVSTGIIPARIGIHTANTSGSLIEALRIDAAQQVRSLATTSSTSTGTGCHIFAGGVGVAGQTTTAQFATTTTTDSSTGTINALANPTGFIRLTGAAPDVRGLANPGTSAARRVVLYCVNATTLTHEAGTASSADRISSDTGANIAVAAGKTVELIYDTVSTRWRPVRF